MPEEKNIMLVDWHSAEWWMRVYNRELSPVEEGEWDAHRATCETCQQEWSAMHRLDALMQHPPAVPSLSPDFTVVTLQRVKKQQRLRSILGYVAGGLIVAGISLSIFVAFTNAFQTMEQYLSVIFSARYLLFQSFVQIVLGLLEGWRMVLPFFVGFTILIFVLLMPNSALFTFAIYWSSRRQQRQLNAA
jgi:hypothetical protein